MLLRHPQVHVLSDDIYEKIIYDGQQFATIAQVEPQLVARTLVLNGVSKSHAMTGWRIGFAGGPAPLIKAMAMLQSQSTSCPSSISQAAACGALTGDSSFLADWIGSFQERRDVVVAMLSKVPGLVCPKPEGAFYVFPACSQLFGLQDQTGKVLQNSADVVAYLLEHAQVAAVPGSAFGL